MTIKTWLGDEDAQFLISHCVGSIGNGGGYGNVLEETETEDEEE
jgi:hypothetical protein